VRVFENRMLRRILGPKRDEAMVGSRKQHSEELHKLYLSSDVIRMIKSRFMRWVRYVAGHLCGLVVRVPGYRSRGPGSDSRCCKIF
jgi:hypothetical protein